MVGGKTMKFTIPKDEHMSSGHLACQGCGAALAMRYALKAMGSKTIFSVPACCWSVIDGPFPYSCLGVPLFHTAFETAASCAAGIAGAMQYLKRDDINVVAWGGDGGTADIGIQALSGAAERGDNILYICYDNEAYMNTGVQRSSSTPYGAVTTTTPGKHWKRVAKKNLVDILVAHNIPYAATASVGFPEDLIKKVTKALTYKGCKFIQIFAPCPPGWKSANEKTIELSRLAVDTCIFPSYEVIEGRYVISRKMREPKPVEQYLMMQGRFRHLSAEEVANIQAQVNKRWKKLLFLEEATAKLAEME
jgi:2-oxoisovalerate ferredoxin oxidoreductase beta subunit